MAAKRPDEAELTIAESDPPAARLIRYYEKQVGIAIATSPAAGVTSHRRRHNGCPFQKDWCMRQ